MSHTLPRSSGCWWPLHCPASRGGVPPRSVPPRVWGPGPERALHLGLGATCSPRSPGGRLRSRCLDGAWHRAGAGSLLLGASFCLSVLSELWPLGPTAAGVGRDPWLGAEGPLLFQVALPASQVTLGHSHHLSSALSSVLPPLWGTASCQEWRGGRNDASWGVWDAGAESSSAFDISLVSGP